MPTSLLLLVAVHRTLCGYTPGRSPPATPGASSAAAARAGSAGSKYPFLAKQSLGQNFLVDDSLARRIVNSVVAERVGVDGSALVELGPGQGALTKHALPLWPRMTALELDKRAIASLAVSLPTLKSAPPRERGRDPMAARRSERACLNLSPSRVRPRMCLCRCALTRPSDARRESAARGAADPRAPAAPSVARRLPPSPPRARRRAPLSLLLSRLAGRAVMQGDMLRTDWAALAASAEGAPRVSVLSNPPYHLTAELLLLLVLNAASVSSCVLTLQRTRRLRAAPLRARCIFAF
jgi:hypothetical protein